MRPRIGAVSHPGDLFGATRATSCIDPDLKRYAIARKVDLARQAFGSKLRAWIEALGETQRAFARRSGVNEISLNKWLQGDASPSPANLDRLRAIGFEP